MALINSLTSGVSALKSFTRGLEVIGNNIANVNTNGFKSSRADYSDSFSNLLQRSSPSDGGNGSNTVANQIGLGTQIDSVTGNFAQGAISPTGVTSDMAIVGEGFFQVVDRINDRVFATRQGNFRVDDRGFITTQDGLRVQGRNGGNIAFSMGYDDVNNRLTFSSTKNAPNATGDLQVAYSPNLSANGSTLQYDAGSGTYAAYDSGGNPVTDGSGNPVTFTQSQVDEAAPDLNSWSVGREGDISFFLSNGETYTAGKLLLMNFRDPQALMREGNGLYTGFEAAGLMGAVTMTEGNNRPGTNGLGVMQAEALELSNVDLTEEFARIITTQRSFQAGARIVTVSDDILNEVVNLKR